MHKYNFKFVGSHEITRITPDSMEQTGTHYVVRTGTGEVACFEKKSVTAWWKE